MMKRLTVFAGVAMLAWTASACSENATPTPTTEAERVIAREIEQGAPIQSTGMASTVLGVMSLAAYPNVLKNGSLRAREVVLQPGATIAIHSHDSRPAVVYVLEGELIEHRNDTDDPVVRRAGDLYFEGPDTVHWSENTSSNPVRVLAVDIVPHVPQ